MDLLAPRTLLPEDPAVTELAGGADPVAVATAHPARPRRDQPFRAVPAERRFSQAVTTRSAMPTSAAFR